MQKRTDLLFPGEEEEYPAMQLIWVRRIYHDAAEDSPSPRAWSIGKRGISESSISPTSRIRPWFKKFSNGKWLLIRGEVARKWSKAAVVQTYPIFIRRFLCIITGHYVFALQHAEEKW